jgi:hypothetical protein
MTISAVGYLEGDLEGVGEFEGLSEGEGGT